MSCLKLIWLRFVGGVTPRGADLRAYLPLILGLLGGCGPSPQKEPPRTSEVMVLVRTDEGQPLEGVMVRAGLTRSVSDEEGVASFSLPVDASLTLSAECPSNTKGEPLVRELRPSMLRAASEWRTTLTCRPEVVQQSIAVVAAGCGEVEVWFDGALLGQTTGGLLHALRPIGEGGVARVEVRPLQGKCEWQTRGLDLTFSRENPGIWAHFQGKRLRAPRVVARSQAVPKPHRPYRL